MLDEHEAAPAGENFPAGQFVHELAPSTEYVPAEHILHEAAPAAEYSPAAQVLHAVCPAGENVPAEQITGGRVRSIQLYPAGHIELPEPLSEKYPEGLRVYVPAPSPE